MDSVWENGHHKLIMRPEEAKNLKTAVMAGNILYQRYHCPCGKTINRYEKSGSCPHCTQPIKKQ